MITSFVGKKITGVLTVLPEKSYKFEDEIAEAEAVRAKRLKKVMGYGQRYRSKANTTMSDMMIYGMEYLLKQEMLKKEDIGAIVVVSLSVDYFLPQISNIIHGTLGLDRSVMCVDIPSACAGYVVGLFEAFMLLEHLRGKKVILLTGDIFNRKASEEEPKFVTPPFGGDVANITVIENSDSEEKIHYNFYTDGTLNDVLVTREGGFRKLLTSEQLRDTRYNLPFRGVDMDGSAVFNFVQKEVPPMIQEILELGGVTKEDVDWYLFHQPNKFMLQKLAERLEIPYKKMPMDVVQDYGNSNSGTIPVAMTSYLASELMEKEYLCCLSGFGAGLTWSSLLMRLGKLDFCENIQSDL